MAAKRSASSEDTSSSRKNAKTGATRSTSELDRAFPETTLQAPLPSYDASKPLNPIWNLPLLPKIQIGRLTEAPFTHSSSLDSKYGKSNDLTYERLEFLGDAYLEVIATRLIYSRFQNLLTGKQSALRELLVRNSTLARFSSLYGFDKRVKIVSSEGLKNKEKILADVFEAYLAAVILSDNRNGFSTAEEWLTELWTPLLLKQQSKAVINRKNDLANMISSKDTRLEYLEDKPMQMLSGCQTFTIGVYFTGYSFEKRRIGQGVGVGKKEAGMLAAADALENNREVINEIIKLKTASDEARQATES